jgi:hypothetical protein
MMHLIRIFANSNQEVSNFEVARLRLVSFKVLVGWVIQQALVLFVGAVGVFSFGLAFSSEGTLTRFQCFY